MLRRLIREAAPQAAEVLSGRGYQFSAHGVFARVEASDRKVLLEFVNGGSLEAPDGVLAGEGPVRNLALTSVDDVTESVLRGLVRQAVLKNLGGGSSS